MDSVDMQCPLWFFLHFVGFNLSLMMMKKKEKQTFDRSSLILSLFM